MARRRILMLRSPRERASRSTHYRPAFGLLCLLLGLAAGAFTAPALAQDTARQVPADREEVMLSFAPVVKKAAPAVVNIFAKRKVEQRAVPSLLDDPFFRRFFGGGPDDERRREREQSSLGSGVIVPARSEEHTS